MSASVVIRPGGGRNSDLIPVVAPKLVKRIAILCDIDLDLGFLVVSVIYRVEDINT